MTRTIGELHVTATSVGVPGTVTQVIASSRDALFNHIRADDLGRYRPLSGARTLPTGWQMQLNTGLPAETAIETVYPLALVHQRQHAQGTLRLVTLDEVLTRQSGRYESTSALSREGRSRAVATVCGECVRQPVWNGSPCARDGIPCPEPCSVLVAFCREAALWEAEPPAAKPVDRHVGWAAFEEPGNQLRERYLERMATTDD